MSNISTPPNFDTTLNSHSGLRLSKAALHPGLNADIIAQQKQSNQIAFENRKQDEPGDWLEAYEPFLLKTLIAFVVGMALSYGFHHPFFLTFPLFCTISVCLIGILVSCIRQPTKRIPFRLSLWVWAFLAGTQFYQWASLDSSPWHAPNAPLLQQARLKQPATLSGIITTSSNSRHFFMAINSLNGRPMAGHVQVDLPFNFSGYSSDAGSNFKAELLQPGREVTVSGLLHEPSPRLVPGTFDQSAYLRSQGIDAVLSESAGFQLGAFSKQPYDIILARADAVKSRIWLHFKEALPSPQAEVFAGLVLGDKAVPVDAATKQAFIDTGLIHLLAASGMNVGIIAGSILLLLNALRVPLRLQIPIAMGTVALYSVLTGLPPSIVRAGTMLEIALLCKLFNQHLSNQLLLCGVTVLILLAQPELIGNMGFQFSVLSTFGLVAMAPKAQDWLGYYITHSLAGIILVPVLAQLWVLPLTLTYFNRFPMHSVFLNIVALFLVTPLTVLGFISALVALIFPQCLGMLTWLASPFLTGLIALSRWGASQQTFQLMLPAPEPWLLIALYALLFFLLFWLAQFKTRRLGSPRAWAFALIPLLVCLLGLGIQKVQFEQQAQLLRISLASQAETQRDAFLFKAQHGNAWIAILPEGLRSAEGRLIRDYYRHSQIHAFKAVILSPVLTGTVKPSHLAKGLERAFTGIPVERVILPESATWPDSIQPLKGFQRLTDQNAIQLNLASSSLMLSQRSIQLNSQSHCLLGIGDGLPSGVTRHCTWNQFNLPSKAFTQLRLDGIHGKIISSIEALRNRL